MEGTSEIIVIGGGVTGLSCAWRLAQKGVRVTVLEQHGPIPGASTASLGVLAYPTPLKQSPFLSLHRTSLGLFPQFAQELEEKSGISIGYSRCSSLEIIPTEPQYEQAEKEVKVVNAQRLKVNGEPAMELLTPRESKQVEREVMTTQFGALYSRLTAQVAVEKLLQALRVAGTAAGVIFRDNCQATGINVSRERVKGVACENETLSCEKVLIAAGAWTPQLSPLLKKNAYVEPVRGQAILVQTDRPLAHAVIKWNQKYVVPLSDNIVALGSTTEKESGFDIGTTLEGINQILTLTMQALPSLASCNIIKLWAGLRPAALDSKPHIGAVPGAEGLFVAAGHYKTGFAFAPLTSEAVADLMTSDSCEFDLDAVAPRLTDVAAKKKRKDGQSGTTPPSDVSDSDL
jgi:glycine oxidase